MAFTFREDGYFNMTKAAAHFGREIHEYLRLPSTGDYIEALAKTLKAKTGISPELVQAKSGRYGRTFGHPKLAIRLAGWLSADFQVWCNSIIEDILRGNAELTITKPEVSATVQASRTSTGSAWKLSPSSRKIPIDYCH